MEITRVKHWTKVVQSENVEHVLIGYDDGDSKHVLHQFDKLAIAAPEFYQAFDNLPVYVCKIMHVGEGLKNGIFVNDVSITKDEDKEGNNTSIYKLICRMKSGHANTVISVTVQHKHIPEGFEQAINALIVEAKEYIGGKREQVDMFDAQPEESDSFELHPDTGEDLPEGNFDEGNEDLIHDDSNNEPDDLPDAE